MDRPNKTEAEQRAFVEAVQDGGRRALLAAGTVARCFAIGGKQVRLLFAGPRLVPHLAAALSHLEVPDCESADAQVIVWDSESTGIAIVDPPCQRRDFTTRGDIWGFHSARYRAAFHWIESSVNVFDLERRTGAYWVESERTLPYWVKASPLRSILHWWAEHNGWQLIHGAAVGTEQGALLITGNGGVGKSTTALVCLCRGLDYLADDYLVVSLDPEPTVHSLYCTAKLTAQQLACLPELFPLVTNRSALDRQKAVLVLGGRWAERVRTARPLVALATPTIERRDDTELVPVGREILHRAATFTTLEQLPYAGDATHAFVERLVEQVPSYELKLGRDLGRIPGTISTFLIDKPWLRAPRASTGGEPAPRPLISVVVPTHNGAKFLPEAIASVLSQDYPALQIIVIDDASTDDTDAVVGRLPCAVRYIKHDRKKGPAEARNRGIRDAVGEYIAFLDVDDLWPARNLHRLMDHLLPRLNLDVVHGYGHLAELEPRTGRYELRGNPRESFPFYIGAGLYRRRVFECVGLFDAELEFAEDTDWYNRAYELGRSIERLHEVTLHVRRHGQNMTAGKSLVELNVLRVFKRALDRKRAREREQAAAAESSVSVSTSGSTECGSTSAGSVQAELAVAEDSRQLGFR